MPGTCVASRTAKVCCQGQPKSGLLAATPWSLVDAVHCTENNFSRRGCNCSTRQNKMQMHTTNFMHVPRRPSAEPCLLPINKLFDILPGKMPVQQVSHSDACCRNLLPPLSTAAQLGKLLCTSFCASSCSRHAGPQDSACPTIHTTPQVCSKQRGPAPFVPTV